MSLFPLCFGAGGDHYSIGDAEQLAFAPLQRIDSAEEQTWAEEWIASPMEMQQFTVMPGHRNAIHNAVQNLSANPEHLRSLTAFYHVVQDREVKEAIQHYTAQGAMGRLLDADADNLSLSPFMVFEIEEFDDLRLNIFYYPITTIYFIYSYNYQEIFAGFHPPESCKILTRYW